MAYKFRCIFCVIIFINLIASLNVNRPYILKAILNDGLREFNIFVNGIRAVELVSLPSGNNTEGIVVRQVTNGKQLVNMIFNGRAENLVLKECHVEKESMLVTKFIDSFEMGLEGEREYAMEPRNITINFIENYRNLTEYNKNVTDFRALKRQCFQYRRLVRKKIHKAHNSKKTRVTRSLNELLIFPGTKWCGNKRLATSYQDLAGHTTTDTCCRDHDLCPISIPMLTKKYGLYNKFLTTISHCSCDTRFKTCLKRTGTGASDIVGRVFFNIVQSKCFVLERQKVCLKYGLWSCYKWGHKRRAVIKEPSPWH